MTHYFNAINIQRRDEKDRIETELAGRGFYTSKTIGLFARRNGYDVVRPEENVNYIIKSNKIPFKIASEVLGRPMPKGLNLKALDLKSVKAVLGKIPKKYNIKKYLSNEELIADLKEIQNSKSI